MLTKMEREEKREKIRKKPNICTALELLEDMDELEAERDRWKERAEALERAARRLFPDELCRMCLHQKVPCYAEPCSSCMHPGNGDDDNWQFDESRFAGEEEEA